MESIATSITDYLISKELVNVKKREWCVYYIQKKELELLNYLLFFVIAVYNHLIVETFVFTISFMILRKRTGGLHMNSPWKCILLSCVMVSLLPCCIYGLDCLGVAAAAMLICSFCIVKKFSPVNHPSIHMNREECRESNKLAVKNFCLLILALLTLSFFNQRTLSACVASAILWDALFIILSKIFKQEVKI